MSRYDLTDFEWRVIEPLLPNKPRGVPRVDDRRVLTGGAGGTGSGSGVTTGGRHVILDHIEALGAKPIIP